MYGMTVCRICLDEKSRIFPINNKELKETWQKLTDIKLNPDPCFPLMACYLCQAHLARSAQLRKRALRAEMLLMEMMSAGVEVTRKSIGLIDRRKNNLHYNYYTTAVDIWESASTPSDILDSIKVELDVEFERLEGGMTLKQEPESNDSVCLFDENVMPYDAQGGTCNSEEKYSLYAEQHISRNVPRTSIQTASHGLLCDDIKDEHAVYNPAATTSFNEAIFPENTYKYKDIRSGKVQCASKFLESKVCQNKVKLHQCKVCSNGSDCVNCVKCKSEPSEILSQGDYLNPDEYRKTALSVSEGKKKSYSKRDFNKPFECELCNCRYSLQSSLKRHIASKHSKGKNVSCDICQYQCTQKSVLIVHMRKHTGEKPFLCDICQSRFSSKSLLQSHMNYKHTKEKKFSCDMCDYRCVKKVDFNVHVLKHTGEKPFSCDICNTRCYRKSDLQSHMKFKHTKEKKFSCDVCNHQFVTKGELNIHTRKHSGERPFGCDLCNSTFACKSVLQSHTRFTHAKEKTFSCAICDCQFKKKFSLKVHMRKHTGERPFSCDVCNTTFYSKAYLQSHMKYRHAK